MEPAAPQEQKDYAAQIAELENEWKPGPDGILRRAAGRVVAFDTQGRVLLQLGHDSADSQHRWWFTPGGGLNPGESAQRGAAREFAEETGVHISATRLIGPVLSRHAVFRFVGETRRQDELFFLVHLTAEEAKAAISGTNTQLTVLEQDVLDAIAWHSPAELAALAAGPVPVYPRELPQYAIQWFQGWDGTMREIHEK
ncbi:NUDIX hydrolase [Actinobaculum suis]|uniref:NUDIX hydrolase n=1 Tax=Actinobaculum suis TaxID=1657 RepID=UPI00066FEFB8|nr:NUDIX domain-containing protein [Actinobaculum suis]KMY22840.1 hypothetical protein ACU19_07405 [Actinobaculum suis]